MAPGRSLNAPHIRAPPSMSTPCGPRPVGPGRARAGRARLTGAPVPVDDLETGWELVAPQVRPFLEREGIRSLLAVPLIREDRLLGGLVILRRQRGAFSPEVVALLQTFAAQSVLAIHN